MTQVANLVRWFDQEQKARRQQLLAQWRGPLFCAALALFAGGGWFAFANLGLSFGELEYAPMFALLFAIIPATIAYSAINMVLMAHAAKVPLSFQQGVKVSVFAQVAEMLPIPGGAIVRTAALVQAGSSTARSAELVVGFALLWIACGGVGAGLALWDLGLPAVLLTSASGLAMLALASWLAWCHGFPVALAATGLRIVGVGLMAIRLSLAFAVLGATMRWVDAAAYAFAVILGSAAAIVPAGLGASEVLAALIAAPGGVDPALAFLAAALSRLLGFGTNMLLALLYLLAGTRTGPSKLPEHG